MGSTKASATKKSSQKKNEGGGTLSLVTSILVLAMSFIIANYDLTSLSQTGPRHSKKVYKSFATFYPFYLKEHSNLICRQLHLVGTSLIIVYALVNRRLMMPVMLSGSIGYVLSSVLAGVEHGFFEFGAMFLIYIISAMMFHKVKFSTLILLPLIGYAFAWVGHFYFEHNRPATFTYPTYSLMGDFRMWFDCVRGREFGLPWAVAAGKAATSSGGWL